MITRHLTALSISAVNSALMWFECVYLWFGVSGDDPGRAASITVALLSVAVSLAWALRGAGRPAAVALNAARLGIALSVALPIVTIAVLLLWESAAGRRDLGMGGMMLYALPVVAFGLSLVLIAGFAFVRRVALRATAAPPAGARPYQS